MNLVEADEVACAEGRLVRGGAYGNEMYAMGDRQFQLQRVYFHCFFRPYLY
jgi:hypothetical protein